MMKVLLAIFFLILSQVVSFYQLQGHLISKWIDKNPFLMVLVGIPFGYSVIWSTKVMIELFNGLTWPNRIIGFSLSILVFSFMTWVYLKEPITPKTLVSIFLCIVIVAIQIFWK